MLGLVLIFATNSHHVMLSALADSYVSLPAGRLPPLDDMVSAIVRVTGDSFSLGVRIAAPFWCSASCSSSASACWRGLMPQIQVFFLAVPLQIVLAGACW